MQLQPTQTTQNKKKKGKMLAAGIIAGATLIATGIAFAQPIGSAFSQLGGNADKDGKKSAATANSTATANAGDPLNDLLGKTDSDSDGLTDKKEAELGTDPTKKDTDGDGYSDKVEVDSGHDPLKNDASTSTIDPAEKTDEELKKQAEDATNKYASEKGSELSDENLEKVLTQFENAEVSQFELPQVPDTDVMVAGKDETMKDYFENVQQKISKNKYISSQDNFQSFIAMLIVADKSELNDVVSIFNSTYADLQRIPVPVSVRDYHKKIMGMIKGCVSIIEELKDRSIENNPDEFIKTIVKFNAIAKYIQETAAEYLQLAKQNNINM